MSFMPIISINNQGLVRALASLLASRLSALRSGPVAQHTWRSVARRVQRVQVLADGG